MTQPEPTARGYNEAEIVAAEEQFDALINAGITAAVAAAVAAILAEPIVSTVTDAIFAPIFTLWNAYTADVLVPELTRVFLGSGEMFLDTLAGTSDPVERAARLVLAYDLDENLPLLDEPAAVWMAEASNRLKNVGTIVWEEIREQLVEGVQAGDSIPELAARVEQAAGFSATRAVKTARTEVAAASNGGSITQARALGLDMDKRWEATSPTDGRTRLTHLEAHHQTVPLSAPFIVGDSELDFPGDPTGEAKEVIQCRCAVTFVNIRRRAEVAAGFDETLHPRDGEGKFAEQAGEDLGVLASIGDLYGPIEHELEWGDQSSGTADPAYGWLTIHENGDSVLSVYEEDGDTAKVVLDSGDSSAWAELADRIERVQGMWEDSDPEDAEGEDERQYLDGIGTGRDGDIGVAYDKDGMINLYMADQGKDNFDIWLDGDETSSLLETLREAERLIDEAQYEDDEDEDEDEVGPEVSAAVIHFVEGQHPRDGAGKFARKAGHADAWMAQVSGALRGEKALNSAPVQLVPDKEGHSGRYGNAELRGLDDDAVKLALSEMEGVEYLDTNNYLRNKGQRPKHLFRPEEIARWEQRQLEGDPQADARIAALDRGMDASVLPEDVVVHRGIKDGGLTFGEDAWYGEFLQGTPDEIDEKWPRWEAGERPDLTGMVWEERAYTHTTVIDGRLKGYARKIGKDQDPVAMNILVPKGTKGVQMSGLDAEGEIMLERGLKYRVVKDHGTDENGVRQWDVEVIPND